MIANFPLKRELGRTVFSIFMLYAGKTSGIVVNLVFLPIYSFALGPDGFGFVAVILSLQALLLMMDLGMSTIVGRDISANEYPPIELVRQLFSAELGLVLLYGALFLVVGTLVLANIRFGMGPFIPLALVVLFALLVLQNLHYSAIVARRAYIASSTLQFVGNLARAGGTAVVLTYISPTLVAFVASQLLGALLQFVAARNLCIREFKIDVYDQRLVTLQSLWHSAFALMRRARPVALLSVAGAAVTQLDKPIISIFLGPSSVAPYFLAMTYCMVPVAVLAGPVAQFFQPLVINAVSTGDDKRALHVMRIYTLALLTITLLPSAVMYVFSDLFVGLWLKHGPLVESTQVYIKILMPGLAIGALGYLPYSLLLVAKDYKFMAILSTIMTAVTLLATTVAAANGSVWLVCAVYVTYHVGSTVLQWVRTLSDKQQIKKLARYSVKLSLYILLIICTLLIIIKSQKIF